MSALVNEVREIRRVMPMVGARKLQVLLRERGHEIGRDRLLGVLREEGLLVKMRRYRAVTTDSRHWMHKWPNLIRGMRLLCMNQLWVSDITYVEVWRGGRKTWMYLSLVTDAYTHEIVGYALHDSLDTSGPLAALMMALLKFPPGSLKGLVHHSDRGAQYCSEQYVSELQRHGILISMTDGGDPYQNAVAERVNGILKKEWIYGMRFSSEKQARSSIESIISLYNHERPHMSVGMLTPVKARALKGEIPRSWKNHGRRNANL